MIALNPKAQGGSLSLGGRRSSKWTCTKHKREAPWVYESAQGRY